MSVSSDNDALTQLAQYGLMNPGAYSQLPNRTGLTQEATGLGGIVSTPLNFGAQNAIIGQQTANLGNIDALANNLGVQKAVKAQEADKLSRQGGLSAGNSAIEAQGAVAKVGEVGQQEQSALTNLGLSERSTIALARLNQTAQTLQQQSLQNTASQATTNAIRDIGLKNQEGSQSVRQAAETAVQNQTAIMQKYNAQQWDFWSKIANGLITAAGTGLGFLIGGPAGALAGGAAGNAIAGATVGSGNSDTSAPQLQNLGTYAPQTGTSVAGVDSGSSETYTTPVLNTPYTGSAPGTATQNAAYTPLPDSLPVT